MRVLIVEDDIQLNMTITEFFSCDGFHTVSVHDGLDAIAKIDASIKKDKFDLFVVDINIPFFDGLELVEYIRAKDIDTPIVVITASLEVRNIEHAFSLGCSEYIKKPFHLKELKIRVDRLLEQNISNNIIFNSDFYYNLDKESFIYKTKAIELRYKEMKLSNILIKNLNHVVSIDMICDYVWDGDIRTEYPLRQLVNSLRGKLPFDIIKTKPKIGYAIEI